MLGVYIVIMLLLISVLFNFLINSYIGNSNASKTKWILMTMQKKINDRCEICFINKPSARLKFENNCS